ncbi:MAG: O-methyltransferase [Acidimicrobiia bacterium]|nr:O-methyltransferase [Acidimicrobiia bacterium]
MSEDRWADVDDYLASLLVPADPVLDEVLEASTAAGLPAINVSPNQGALLAMLARLHGARTVLEVGTLAGYSTIWLARALSPGGQVVTLEVDPAHAEVARANFVRAGVDDRITLRLGRALDSLPALADEGAGPFDLFFIDADKANNPEYFRWAMRLSRAGSLIVIDNVVRDGAVLDADSADPAVVGTRRLHELLAAEPGVTATVVQTVGAKGWDGFALALVTAGTRW